MKKKIFFLTIVFLFANVVFAAPFSPQGKRFDFSRHQFSEEQLQQIKKMIKPAEKYVELKFKVYETLGKYLASPLEGIKSIDIPIEPFALFVKKEGVESEFKGEKPHRV